MIVSCLKKINLILHLFNQSTLWVHKPSTCVPQYNSLVTTLSPLNMTSCLLLSCFCWHFFSPFNSMTLSSIGVLLCVTEWWVRERKLLVNWLVSSHQWVDDGEAPTHQRAGYRGCKVAGRKRWRRREATERSRSKLVERSDTSRARKWQRDPRNSWMLMLFRKDVIQCLSLFSWGGLRVSSITGCKLSLMTALEAVRFDWIYSFGPHLPTASTNWETGVIVASR